jgi:hypothetical protein
MRPRPRLSFALFLMPAAVATSQATAAVNVSGGIDPTTGLTTLGSWILSLVGVAIPIICAFKGTHAVAEGRHLAPYIGSAIGGMVLAFGGAYILTHYGVT